MIIRCVTWQLLIEMKAEIEHIGLISEIRGLLSTDVVGGHSTTMGWMRKGRNRSWKRSASTAGGDPVTSHTRASLAFASRVERFQTTSVRYFDAGKLAESRS